MSNPAIDLTRHMQCIAVMREYGTYDGQKIGMVRQDVQGLAAAYSPGQVLLFRDEGDNTVTIEHPMTLEQIARQKEHGSLLTTIGTMVHVPKNYIVEIRLA